MQLLLTGKRIKYWGSKSQCGFLCYFFPCLGLPQASQLKRNCGWRRQNNLTKDPRINLQGKDFKSSDFEETIKQCINLWLQLLLKTSATIPLTPLNLNPNNEIWTRYKAGHPGGEWNPEEVEISKFSMHWKFHFLSNLRWTSQDDGSVWWSHRTGRSNERWEWQRARLGRTTTTRRHRRRTWSWGSPSMTASRIRAARSRRRGKGKVGNDFFKGNFHIFHGDGCDGCLNWKGMDWERMKPDDKSKRCRIITN